MVRGHYIPRIFLTPHDLVWWLSYLKYHDAEVVLETEPCIQLSPTNTLICCPVTGPIHPLFALFTIGVSLVSMECDDKI